MTHDSSVTAAEARAANARDRLVRTLGALQDRLDPKTVAREAMDGIADTGQQALGSAVEVAQRNPGKVAAAAAAVVLFAARHRIFALFRKSDVAKHGPARHVHPIQHRRTRREEEAP